MTCDHCSGWWRWGATGFAGWICRVRVGMDKAPLEDWQRQQIEELRLSLEEIQRRDREGKDAQQQP